jgi:hypothetical protein
MEFAQAIYLTYVKNRANHPGTRLYQKLYGAQGDQHLKKDIMDETIHKVNRYFEPYRFMSKDDLREAIKQVEFELASLPERGSSRFSSLQNSLHEYQDMLRSYDSCCICGAYGPCDKDCPYPKPIGLSRYSPSAGF